MFKPIAIYGFVCGLFAAVAMSVLVLLLKQQSLLYGYLTLLLASTAVFLGIKHYRDRVLGGAIKFGRAFLVGLGISFLAGIIYALGWDVASSMSGIDFADSYSKAMIEAARAKDLSEADLQKAIAEANEFATSYRSPWFRLPMVFIEIFPVGVLVSLISAALLRNDRFLPAAR